MPSKSLYGGTSAVANQILTEGDNSPADVFIAQDGGALGALAAAEMLSELPQATLDRVIDPAFVSPGGVWVGLSGRARVLVYKPETLEELELDLPESILDLTGEQWRGIVGWAPTNASFVANVTAMRILLGDEETAQWLEDMIANDVQSYPKNTPIVQAVIDGEIALGLVNHYYLFPLPRRRSGDHCHAAFLPGWRSRLTHQYRWRRDSQVQRPARSRPAASGLSFER